MNNEDRSCTQGPGSKEIQNHRREETQTLVPDPGQKKTIKAQDPDLFGSSLGPKNPEHVSKVYDPDHRGGRGRGGTQTLDPSWGVPWTPKFQNMFPKSMIQTTAGWGGVGGEPRPWTPDLGKSSSGDPGPPKIPKHVSKVYDPDHRGGEPRPWTPDPGKSSSGVPGPPQGELQAKKHQSWRLDSFGESPGPSRGGTLQAKKHRFWSLDSFGESPGLSKTQIFGPGPPAGGSSGP